MGLLIDALVKAGARRGRLEAKISATAPAVASEEVSHRSSLKASAAGGGAEELF